MMGGDSVARSHDSELAALRSTQPVIQLRMHRVCDRMHCLTNKQRKPHAARQTACYCGCATVLNARKLSNIL